MRIVGVNKDHSEFALDPVEAFRRGCVLDATLRSAAAPHPRGLFRGTFAYFARIDEERMIMTARRINGP